MSKLEAKQFGTPDEVRPFTGHGHVDLVQLTTGPVGLGTFEPGWRWSEIVKPLAGTDSCQVEHIGYVLEGRMALRMDDGIHFTAAGDALIAPTLMPQLVALGKLRGVDLRTVPTGALRPRPTS